MRKVKRVFQYIFFWWMLGMAIGFTPNRVSFCMYCLSALSCPFAKVRRIVDMILEQYTQREIWIPLMMLAMMFAPTDCLFH